MQAKKITGSYSEVCQVLIDGGAHLLENIIRDADPETVREEIQKDIARMPFLGTLKQKNSIRESWLSNTTAYTQGDESGISMLTFIAPHCGEESELNMPVISDGRTLSSHPLRFAYSTDHQQTAGLSIFCRRDEPSSWMMCVITNAAADLQERVVSLYFSEELFQRFPPKFNIEYEAVDLFTDLDDSIQSKEILAKVVNVFTYDGAVDFEEAESIGALAIPFMTQGNRTWENKYVELNGKRNVLLKLEDSVSCRKAQVYTHLMELIDKADSLRNAGYKDDADIALKLANKLTEKCEKCYLNIPQPGWDNWRNLKKECKVLINEAQKKLIHYELWEQVIGNFLLAITGLCLIKAAITGKFFLRNPGSECVEEIENTYEVVKDIGRQKSG
jgi:hypothetical protein